ncbi:caspase family protein [candidate division WOR-3 bacterium]|nr:caspase family protein [candidate division WOR-3 bacterium]
MIGVFWLSFLLISKAPDLIVSADTAFDIRFSGGRSSFLVFEDRYVDLEISVNPWVSFVVYDDEGNILAKSTDGKAVVNTFFNYWFTVKFSGASVNSASVRVQTAEDYRRLSAVPRTGRLEPSQPSEVFNFTPEVSGIYEFSLSSDDRGGDIDIKLYTSDDEFLTGGVSDGNKETVRTDIFAGDSVTAIVYLNDISKTVDYTLFASRKGDLRELQTGRTFTGRLREDLTQNSFLFNSSGAKPVVIYLNANSSDDDVDLDLYVEFGERTHKSASYSSREMILLPPDVEEVFIEVKAYNLENSQVSYSLKAEEVTSFMSVLSSDFTKRIQPDNPYIFGVTTTEEGFYYFKTMSFEKRDVDMILFDGYGETELKFNTLNPSEIAAIWLDRRDTVFVMPMLYERESDIDISFGYVDLDTIEQIKTGEQSTGTVRPPFEGVKLYSLSFEENGTAAVTVRGESSRDRDVDLFVSGRRFYRRSEGSENPTDMASDETVLFGVNPGEYYLAEVYSYGRGDRCRYDISSRLIEDNFVQTRDGQGKTWAVIVGISGYPGEASLNRATQDALEFYDLLVKNGIIKAENTIFLADENATKNNIITAISNIASAGMPGDKFVFFFSGHGDRKRFSSGTLEEDGFDESICPYSADDDGGDIFDDELNAAIPEYLESYIFLDACHSGGFVEDMTSRGKRLVITASEEDREVGERVLTPILLRAFRGEADRNSDFWLTSNEIVDFVRDRSKHICPECLWEFSGSVPRTCPNCGINLTGENRPMDPELGVSFEPDKRIFRVNPNADSIESGGKEKR